MDGETAIKNSLTKNYENLNKKINNIKIPEAFLLRVSKKY
jgi:hypothetical protein